MKMSASTKAKLSALLPLAMILALLVAVIVFAYVYGRVRTVWQDNGSLSVVSHHNGIVVMHLVYTTAQEDVIAALPQPAFEPDSYGPVFSFSHLQSLEWHNRKGERKSPPTTYDKVRAVYFIPRYSEGVTR